MEMGAENAPVQDVNWDLKHAEVHSDPIMEGGTGEKLIVRRFQLRRPPGVEQVSHEELLDWHKKHTVIPQLWKDELELADEPRIIAGNKGAFTIVAICAPRYMLGVRSTIHERASLAQDIIQKNG